MALVGIAVVGKDNEPLYMNEFTSNANTIFDARYDFEDDIILGFSDRGCGGDGDGPSSEERRSSSCSLRLQFILHAALDRFEELAGPTSGYRWRTPGSTGTDAHWVGLLCPMEELRVYGYITTTRIKFLLAVEDSFLPDQPQQQQAREAELKTLVSNIHMLYVEHTLNPFSKINARIVSKKFDDGVTRFVNAFNGAGTAVI